MRLRPIAILVAAVIAAGCLQGNERPQEVGEPGPVPGEPEGAFSRVLTEGSQSGIHAFRTVVARDESEFRGIWDLHTARSPDGSRGEMPRVDWGNETVAGVFLGDQPNACYGVGFDDVVPSMNNDTLVVTWHRVTPGPGQVCAQVVTQPFFLVVLEGTGLQVSFEELDAQEGRSGGA